MFLHTDKFRVSPRYLIPYFSFRQLFSQAPNAILKICKKALIHISKVRFTNRANTFHFTDLDFQPLYFLTCNQVYF